MKNFRLCLLAGGLLAGLSPTCAQVAPNPPEPPRSRLIVVEDRGGTSALPYYEALNLQPGRPPMASREAPRVPAHANPEADMLPVRSARLTPGEVTRRTIQAPGLRPLFLVGDDPRSRAWLVQRLSRLRDLQAVGLVVQVETTQTLEILRRLAPGLTLSPVSGDDLAQRLGIRHYPVLITAAGFEQ